MIAYRDFAPQIAKPRGLSESLALKEPTHQTFEDALRAANDWIQADAINVVNIETVVLPNIWSYSERGPTDVEPETVSGHATWYQFIRVWHRTR
jgi:hypothetical protein